MNPDESPSHASSGVTWLVLGLLVYLLIQAFAGSGEGEGEGAPGGLRGPSGGG